MLDETLEVIKETSQQADNRGSAPVVIMNSNSAHTEIVEVAPRRRRGPSGGVAVLLEFLFGFFLLTFGIGHMYTGRVAVGLMMMFVGWFLLAVNVAFLFFCGIGFVTLPVCWIAMLIISPICAASACR